MKPTKYTLLLILFLGIWLQAQDRQKELDSLIQHATSLPEDTLKAKVLSRIHERMMVIYNMEIITITNPKMIPLLIITI